MTADQWQNIALLLWACTVTDGSLYFWKMPVGSGSESKWEFEEAGAHVCRWTLSPKKDVIFTYFPSIILTLNWVQKFRLSLHELQRLHHSNSPVYLIFCIQFYFTMVHQWYPNCLFPYYLRYRLGPPGCYRQNASVHVREQNLTLIYAIKVILCLQPWTHEHYPQSVARRPHTDVMFHWKSCFSFLKFSQSFVSTLIIIFLKTVGWIMPSK